MMTSAALAAAALPLLRFSSKLALPAAPAVAPLVPALPAAAPAAAIGPGTLSVLSTNPARRTHALLLVYFPNPPLGPIFSKWLSPYCHPSSSTCHVAKRFDSCHARPAEEGVV